MALAAEIRLATIFHDVSAWPPGERIDAVHFAAFRSVATVAYVRPIADFREDLLFRVVVSPPRRRAFIFA